MAYFLSAHYFLTRSLTDYRVTFRSGAAFPSELTINNTDTVDWQKYTPPRCFTPSWSRASGRSRRSAGSSRGGRHGSFQTVRSDGLRRNLYEPLRVGIVKRLPRGGKPSYDSLAVRRGAAGSARRTLRRGPTSYPPVWYRRISRPSPLSLLIDWSTSIGLSRHRS